MNRRAVIGTALLALALACHSGTPARAGSNTQRVAGRVLERLDAPPYSFLRLEQDEREVWIAVPIGTASSGEEVALTNGVTLRNYEAKALGKRFDEVVFGTTEQR